MLGRIFGERQNKKTKDKKAKDRRQRLQELLGEGDEHEDIRGKMLAVLFNTEYVNLITFIHAHGSAFIDGNERFDKDLEERLLFYICSLLRNI